MAEKPTVAFVLSLIGGILVLLVALTVTAYYVNTGYDPNATMLTAFLSGFGFLGLIWGSLMLVGAIMLYVMPEQHQLWGAMVLVFSIASWFGSFGGFVIGFVLGLVGGIPGIVWNPKSAKAVDVPPPAIG